MKRAKTILIVFSLVSLLFSYSAVIAKEVKPTILVWQTLTEERVVATIKKLLVEYEKRSGNRTALSVMPADPFWIRWGTSLAAGTTPDVCMVMADFVQPMAAEGHLIPVDDIIGKLGRDDFYPAALKAFTRDGKVYGVPAFISAMNVFYRKDVFEERGLKPPKTWDDLLNAATKLAKNPTKLHGQEFGYTVPAAKNILSCYHLWAWMRTNGADIFDKNGKVIFNSPGTVQTVEFLKKLYFQGSPKGSTGYSWGDVKESYWSGRSAMIAYYGGVTADMPKYAPKLVKKTGIVSMPRKKQAGTHAFAYAWVIPKYTAYPDLARDFIANTLMKPENHIAWLNSDPTDNLPPRKSLAANPVFWQNPTIVMLKPLVEHMLKAAQTGDVFAQGNYPSEKAGEILGSLVVADALSRAIAEPKRPVAEIVAEVDREIRKIAAQ